MKSIQKGVCDLSSQGRQYKADNLLYPKHDENIDSLPDLLFYVFLDGKRMAFQRMDAKDFKTKRKFFCIKMIPDIYNFPKSDIHEGGLLVFSLRGWDRAGKINLNKIIFQNKN